MPGAPIIDIREPGRRFAGGGGPGDRGGRECDGEVLSDEGCPRAT